MKNSIAVKLIVIMLAFFILGYNPNDKRVPAEDLNVPSAVGIDMEKINSNVVYKISMCSYIFQEGQQTEKKVSIGEGFTPLQTRQNRILKVNKNFIIGLEKVDVINEEGARIGIRSILDVLFNNPEINDTALLAICEGNAKDMLDLGVKGYPTSGDYLEKMINNSKTFNFFEDNYKLIDVFARTDSEGRSVKLPYIKRTKEGIVIDGLAIFKNDKMIEKIDVSDAKTLNMLSSDAGKGMVAVQKNSDMYTDYYTIVKRKVKCTKENGKYTFNINLNFKGNLVTNQYNKETQNKFKEKQKLEKELESKIEKQSKEFINKMQNVYKIDCLELGRIAAAKYGRDTGTDWDKVISNSQINVKASVKINGQGRGNY